MPNIDPIIVTMVTRIRKVIIVGPSPKSEVVLLKPEGELMIFSDGGVPL